MEDGKGQGQDAPSDADRLYELSGRHDPEALHQAIWESQQARHQAAKRAGLRFTFTHMGLIASGTVFLLVAIRVLAVSRWSFDTFVGLASVSSPFATLLPAMLAIAESATQIVFWGAVVAVARSHRPPWLRGIAARVTVATSAATPMVILSPWDRTLWALPLGALILWAIPAQGKANATTIREAAEGDETAQRRLRTLSPSKGPSLMMMIGAVLLLAFAIDNRPWMPAEDLALDDGRLVAYSVAHDGSDEVFLRDSDRALVRIPREAIEGRSFCSTGQRNPSVLGLLLGPRAEYPKCPTPSVGDSTAPQRQPVT